MDWVINLYKMAKLEELTELLVTEIRDFENAVVKLEKIQKEQIRIDLIDIKEVISEHQELMRRNNLAFDEQMRLFQVRMDFTKKYLNWILIGIFISFGLNTIFFVITVIGFGGSDW